MTPAQLDLFTAPPTRGRSRRTDPHTSRDAARQVNVGEGVRRVLLALSHGPCNDAVLHERVGCMKLGSVIRRRGDARDAGWVLDTGRRVDGRVVWSLSESGADRVDVLRRAS